MCFVACLRFFYVLMLQKTPNDVQLVDTYSEYDEYDDDEYEHYDDEDYYYGIEDEGSSGSGGNTTIIHL